MSKKHKRRNNRKNKKNPGFIHKGYRVIKKVVELGIEPIVAAAREFSDKVPAKATAASEPYVYKSCAKSHPALDLGNGLLIYGGAAHSPIVGDADIYVSLDRGMDADTKGYPWNGGRQFIYFPITDMSAPADAAEFKKLISWLAAQVKAGHKVHVGCIGGHGRTGTVFSALVKEMSGNVNAIQYVRDHYCPKAVESATQVDFLVKHYGVARVKGAKSYDSYVSPAKFEKKSFYDRYTDYGYEKDSEDMWNKYSKSVLAGNAKPKLGDEELAEKDVAVVDPTPKKGNVWGLDPAEEAAPADLVGID